tara:strand:- start:131 stop:373 length:243 start_codon:yes stop_codon:yes gene_type:complete
VDDDEDGLDEQENPTTLTFEQQFGWFAILNRIADNDFTKHNKIAKGSLVSSLNQLTFILAQEKEILKRQRAAQTNGGMVI